MLWRRPLLLTHNVRNCLVLRDVQTLTHPPRMPLKNEMIIRTQRAKFMACYKPHSKMSYFPDQGNVYTTFSVLYDTAILITNKQYWDTTRHSLIVSEIEELSMRAKRAETFF